MQRMLRRLSVRNVAVSWIRDHICRNSSKVISRLFSMGCSLSQTQASQVYWNIPEIFAGIGLECRQMWLFVYYSSNISETRQDRIKVFRTLLGTNTKLRTCRLRAFDWCENQQQPRMISKRDSRSLILYMLQNWQNLSVTLRYREVRNTSKIISWLISHMVFGLYGVDSNIMALLRGKLRGSLKFWPENRWELETRSQAVASIADRTAKSCRGHVT